MANINEQMGVLREEKQGCTAALNQLLSDLLSEHQNVLDRVKGLRDQRDKMNQEDSSKDSRCGASEIERDFF